MKFFFDLRSRSSFVLALGFGSVIVLIAVLGFGAMRRARTIYNEMESTQDSYLESESFRRDVASDMYLADILVRDYLLDPSPENAPRHREDLLQIRDSLQKRMDLLAQKTGESNNPGLTRLQNEVQGYWDSLDPIFEWTPRRPEDKEAPQRSANFRALSRYTGSVCGQPGPSGVFRSLFDASRDERQTSYEVVLTTRTRLWKTQSAKKTRAEAPMPERALRQSASWRAEDSRPRLAPIRRSGGSLAPEDPKAVPRRQGPFRNQLRSRRSPAALALSLARRSDIGLLAVAPAPRIVLYVCGTRPRSHAGSRDGFALAFARDAWLDTSRFKRAT